MHVGAKRSILHFDGVTFVFDKIYARMNGLYGFCLAFIANVLLFML